MPFLCFNPPYLTPHSACRLLPALGAVLLADLQDGIPALAEALRGHCRAPWCPLILLVSDPRMTREVFSTFEPWAGCFGTLSLWEPSTTPTVARVLQAVRRRPLPVPGAIAAYIERRLHPAAGGSQVIRACVDGVGTAAEGLAAGNHARRTLSRRVRALGTFEVREWRGLARLVRVLATAGRQPLSSLEAAAWNAGADPRSLRRWIAHFTGLDWGELRSRPGWEWVVELALRRAGYLAEAGPGVQEKAS
jgi:hypothetical protein